MYSFHLRTSFLFHTFLCFFLCPNYIYMYLGCVSCPFFRFFASYGRKMHFLLFRAPKNLKKQKTYSFHLRTSFLFHTFFLFFLCPNYVYMYLGCVSCPFFRFFPSNGRKIHFFRSKPVQKCLYEEKSRNFL